jgi:AraC-like DNA-binding protein
LADLFLGPDEGLSSVIADPALCPAKVVAHFGVSVRYLHKVLEEGSRSFGRLSLERRLERCAKDFARADADPGTITEIALRWGFNDMSHFSRTFRQRFGKTPRDYCGARTHDLDV